MEPLTGLVIAGLALLFLSGKGEAGPTTSADAPTSPPPPPKPPAPKGKLNEWLKKSGPWGLLIAAVAVGFSVLSKKLGEPVSRLAEAWVHAEPHLKGARVLLLPSDFRKWARLNSFADEVAVMLHRHRTAGGPDSITVQRTHPITRATTRETRQVRYVIAEALAYVHVARSDYPWSEELGRVVGNVPMPDAPWSTVDALLNDPLVAEGRSKWWRKADPLRQFPRAVTLQPNVGDRIRSGSYYRSKVREGTMRPPEPTSAVIVLSDTNEEAPFNITGTPTLPVFEADVDAIINFWRMDVSQVTSQLAVNLPPRRVWHVFKAAFSEAYDVPSWATSDQTFIPGNLPKLSIRDYGPRFG